MIQHKGGHVIEDISKSNFKNIYENDEGYMSYELLEKVQPYFELDLPNASPNEKIQWFKNIFWLTTELDLGLAHAIHHNQAARNYVKLLEDKELKDKILNSPWATTIGSDNDIKGSSTVTIREVPEGYILNGEANWLTNAKVADYATMPALDPKGNKFKVIIDLNSTPHTIKSNWPLITGMRMASPASIVLDNALIPKAHCLGVYGYPNKFHYAEALDSVSFITNMTANIVALWKEVYGFAKNIDRGRDLQLIDTEIDVFTMINRWMTRMNQYTLGEHDHASEEYWAQHLHLYLFGKKTLIKVINLSRIMGIQKHLFRDGDESRVFRNALTFSSHMFKLHDYTNLWGNESHSEFDIDSYIHHHFNKLIHGTAIPGNM